MTLSIFRSFCTLWSKGFFESTGGYSEIWVSIKFQLKLKKPPQSRSRVSPKGYQVIISKHYLLLDQRSAWVVCRTQLVSIMCQEGKKRNSQVMVRQWNSSTNTVLKDRHTFRMIATPSKRSLTPIIFRHTGQERMSTAHCWICLANGNFIDVVKTSSRQHFLTTDSTQYTCLWALKGIGKNLIKISHIGISHGPRACDCKQLAQQCSETTSCTCML